jgi:hypothetical protein
MRNSSVTSSPTASEWSIAPATEIDVGCHLGQFFGVVKKAKTSAMSRWMRTVLATCVPELGTIRSTAAPKARRAAIATAIAKAYLRIN